MRLRTDEWWDAGRKRAVELGAVPDPRNEPDEPWAADWLERLSDPTFEAAQPGDAWRVRWAQPPRTVELVTGETRQSWAEAYGPDSDPEWPLAGYVLTCSAEGCFEGVHSWVDAGNCSCGGQAPGYPEHDATDLRSGEPYHVRAFGCCHMGSGSCWQWTGSPEAGDLTAQPSLYAVGANCEWHGFLTNGEMRSV